jgi:hypothetical protein
MGQPITVTDGICFAFPDVCLTPAPPSPPIPVPYPNIAQLADATGTASNVNAGGKPVVIDGSTISQSTGDEAGSNGGVTREGQRQGHRPARRQHDPEQGERGRHRARRAAERAGRRLR